MENEEGCQNTSSIANVPKNMPMVFSIKRLKNSFILPVRKILMLFTPQRKFLDFLIKHKRHEKIYLKKGILEL
jgi:hypothetical protein